MKKLQNLKIGAEKTILCLGEKRIVIQDGALLGIALGRAGCRQHEALDGVDGQLRLGGLCR